MTAPYFERFNNESQTILTSFNLQIRNRCTRAKILIVDLKMKSADFRFRIPFEQVGAWLHLLLRLRVVFGGHLLVVEEEPGVHVLALALVRVTVVAVQVLRGHVHACRHAPAQRPDGLNNNHILTLLFLPVMQSLR